MNVQGKRADAPAVVFCPANLGFCLSMLYFLVRPDLNSASLDKPRELHDKCNVTVTPKQLANLRRPARGERPRRRDGSLAVSPGRPATRWLVEMIRADYARNPAKIVALLRKRKIEVYCAYGFGKPAETVQVGGIPGQPVQLEDISRLSIPELQQRLAVLKAKGEA